MSVVREEVHTDYGCERVVQKYLSDRGSNPRSFTIDSLHILC
jgi:hypothetical protein